MPNYKKFGHFSFIGFNCYMPRLQGTGLLFIAFHYKITVFYQIKNLLL